MTDQTGDQSTRERIVEAAVGLFYEEGFAGASMAELPKRARANSGSFYHFFRSKEDVLNAVLDWYHTHLEPILIEPVCVRTADPIERIFALLECYRQRLIATRCTYGCPIGRLALEIDPKKRKVHANIAGNFAGWSAAVHRFLQQAGHRLPRRLNRADLAQFVLTVMEGGAMQSRSFRRIGPYDASVRQLRRYFQRLEAEAALETQRPGLKPSPGIAGHSVAALRTGSVKRERISGVSKHVRRRPSPRRRGRRP